jgi:hypothetical protein
MTSPRDPSPQLRALLTSPTLAPLWLVLPAAWLTIELAWTPQDSWDLWWHLAAGRITHAQGAPADRIYFLYTLPDQPIPIQPWLAQWLLYLAYQAGGPAPLLILRNLMSGLAFFAVSIAAWRRHQTAWAGVVPALLGTLFGAAFIQVRTHLLAWPLFLLCLWLAYTARTRIKSHDAPCRWLPVSFAAITALWVNLHGSFILPTLISLSFLADAIADRWRDPTRFKPRCVALWAMTLAGSALATLCNPWGAGVWTYVLSLVGNTAVQQITAEWRPTTLSQPGDLGAMFWVTYLGGAALLARFRRSVSVADACLFLGLGLMAARQCRELMWFGFALPIVLAPALRAGLDTLEPLRPTPPSLARAGRVIAALLVAAALLLQPWAAPQRDLLIRQDRFEARRVDPERGLILAEAPVEAIAPLKRLIALRPTLRIHHEQEYAGFLLWHIQRGDAPWPMVSLDQRLELPPASLYALLDQVNAAHGWRAFFATQRVEAALLRERAQPELVAALASAPDWRCVARGHGWRLFAPAALADQADLSPRCEAQP